MEHSHEYPESIARFYDIIYTQLRRVDRNYFFGKILETKGPILEVGVGTGRFFIEALDRGADIDGVDNSTVMLNRLKGKLEQRHHSRIYLQDARTMSLPRKYDLIIAPFRVFSHLIAVQDQLQVLGSIYNHLNKNGRFIFDVYVPDLSNVLKGIHEEVDFEGEYLPDRKLKRIVSSKPDLINQISDVTMTFIWDEEGEEKTETWRAPMRYFFRYELEHLVYRSKLSLKNIFGDYEEGELRSDSKDFVVVCERTENT